MVKRAPLLSLIVFMVFYGCAASKIKYDPRPISERMREYYFKYHPEVDSYKYGQIKIKNIYPGFSCGDVILAWGWPDYKSRIDYGRIQIWSYEVTYSPQRLLIFEDGRLKNIKNSTHLNFVKFGETHPRPQTQNYATHSTPKGEMEKLTNAAIHRVFERKRMKEKVKIMKENRFVFAEKFKKDMASKGIEVVINKKDEKVRIELMNNNGSGNLPFWTIRDIIPGLPENIVALEIGAERLAFILNRYQWSYKGNCTLKEDDGSLRDYIIVLNWRKGGNRKPEVFKTTTCSGVQKKDGEYIPVDERNEFRKGDGKEVVVFIHLMDLEAGSRYKVVTRWYGPNDSPQDGPNDSPQAFAKNEIKATGFAQFFWHSIKLDQKINRPIGPWKVKIFVNSFLLDTVEFTLLDN